VFVLPRGHRIYVPDWDDLYTRAVETWVLRQERTERLNLDDKLKTVDPERIRMGIFVETAIQRECGAMMNFTCLDIAPCKMLGTDHGDGLTWVSGEEVDVKFKEINYEMMMLKEIKNFPNPRLFLPWNVFAGADYDTQLVTIWGAGHRDWIELDEHRGWSPSWVIPRKRLVDVHLLSADTQGNPTLF
jgi:hypothetical protein